MPPPSIARLRSQMDQRSATGKMIKPEPLDGEEGHVKKCSIKDDFSGSAAAVQPVLLHHGLPADRYALVLPAKLSSPPAAITISIADHSIRDSNNNAMKSVVRMGPCGGGGGDAKDMDMHGVNRVVRVVVRHGLAIDAVSVLYERNGREEWTDLWGGHGGKRSEIRLQPDEYLTSVEGHYGEYRDYVVIRSLTFVGNHRSFGPYGKKEGVTFALPAGAGGGGKIVGFHARSGSLLDSLGTYVRMD